MSFPIKRLRRLRQSIPFRNLVRETALSVNDLIAPLFVVPGKGVKKEISSMPGQYHFSVDTLLKECQEIYDLGIPAIILFGIPENKDCDGSEAYAPDGIVQVAIREIKIAVPDLLVITDVCMCEYTSHGHCGILDGQVVDNDTTLEKLGEIAVSHASAGADMIAPSDMMDGRIMAIRSALDTADFQDIPVMSYAAKYASAYYGPFRDAALSAPQFGDRRSYQMDPANSREALEEVAMDEAEGADILMVKPALAYLDIIHAVRQNTNLPVAAYNVSGEYSMIKNAAAQGLVDGEAIMMETLLSIKRAGAELILTYFAKEAAEVIHRGS